MTNPFAVDICVWWCGQWPLLLYPKQKIVHRKKFSQVIKAVCPFIKMFRAQEKPFFCFQEQLICFWCIGSRSFQLQVILLRFVSCFDLQSLALHRNANCSLLFPFAWPSCIIEVCACVCVLPNASDCRTGDIFDPTHGIKLRPRPKCSRLVSALLQIPAAAFSLYLLFRLRMCIHSLSVCFCTECKYILLYLLHAFGVGV